MTAVKRVKIKQCEYCGAEFEYKHGNAKICPTCYGVVTENRGRHSPSIWNTPNLNQDAYERAIIRNAIARAAHNDNIIGEGYADRQIADTLSKVEPINTKL